MILQYKVNCWLLIMDVGSIVKVCKIIKLVWEKIVYIFIK
jgi:hypothetical protein